MKHPSIAFLFAIASVAAFPVLLVQCAGSKQMGEDRGAYESGAYRNLFVELLARDSSQVRAKIDSAFNTLFFGNDSTERVYYPVHGDMAYVEDIFNNDVRTEGMSYGMMICVQLDRKREFDCLWKWAKTHMQLQVTARRGYFAWHCRSDGTVLDSVAASDGEEWFVMALFFASARWGDGEGIYAYASEARKILHTMLHKESEPDHGTVTNMFNSGEHLVAFVPSRNASTFTDPSYQLPHFYELWARWGDRDNAFWCQAALRSRAFLRRAADSTTGLFPDYAHFDGTPISPWAGGHEDFRFDAWRVAMNIAIDYQWFRKDPWQVTEANRLLAFFSAEGIDRYGNQYTLGGRKLSNDHSPGLVAMNAVAALAATSGKRREFVEALWNTPIPKGLYRYYDGLLYMLAMLQVSGNFRIYGPPQGATLYDCPDN